VRDIDLWVVAVCVAVCVAECVALCVPVRWREYVRERDL